MQSLDVVGWSNWLEEVELDLICVKQLIQCWPLIGQAVVEEAGKEEVDAKKTLVTVYGKWPPSRPANGQKWASGQ